MAIISEFGVICDAEVLAHTAESTNNKEGSSIDLTKVAPGDIGSGEPIYFEAVVNADIKLANGASDGTFTIRLVTDDDESFDGNSDVLAFAKFVTKAGDALAADRTLTKGTKLISYALGQEGVAYKRYLGVLTDVGTTALTQGADAGKIDAYLTRYPNKIKAYADGAPAVPPEA